MELGDGMSHVSQTEAEDQDALELEIWRAYLDKYDGMPPYADKAYAIACYESFHREYLRKIEVKKEAGEAHDEQAGSAYSSSNEPYQEKIEHLRSQLANITCEGDDLLKQLNTPEIEDFAIAVVLEAQHQRHRWGSEHDAGKEPQDWFWLVGYLAGKCLRAHIDGNREKALHHMISTAAALANWHAAISGINTEMRPGVDPVQRQMQEQQESSVPSGDSV